MVQTEGSNQSISHCIHVIWKSLPHQILSKQGAGYKQSGDNSATVATLS